MKIAVKVQLQSVEKPSRSDVGRQSMDLKPDNIGVELAANRWLQTKVSVAKLLCKKQSEFTLFKRLRKLFRESVKHLTSTQIYFVNISKNTPERSPYNPRYILNFYTLRSCAVSQIC